MIRRATEEDLDSLLPLVEEFYRVDGHDFDGTRVASALVPLLASDLHGVVLVSEEAEPNGYAVLVWSYSIESGGRDSMIDELFVRVPGIGIGSDLIGGVLAVLREQGIGRIFLETERSNHRARDFYSRHGFTVEDSVWMSADLG